MGEVVKRSSSSAETSKVKRNIMFDMEDRNENQTLDIPMKRKSEAHLESIPKRSKIVTNPQTVLGYPKPKTNLQNVRTPVRMGIRTLVKTNIKPIEKKIVCITLSR